MGKRLFLITILGLFCLANVTRWAYRSKISNPRFVAEGAAHLRYTEMIAEGRTLPALDRQAQWPEGLHVFRETSPGMEFLYGIVYRLIPGQKPDLSTFIRYFTAFFFSLAIVPVAFLSASLWKSKAAGILTATLFAVSLPLVGRSSGFEFIRENVTLTLLIYHIYFFLSACTGGSRRGAVLSAAFLLGALSTWQGTQFYLIPLFCFVLARRIVTPIDDGERRAVRMLFLSVLVAGAVIPFLREGRFLLSLSAGLAVAWLAADLIPPAGWRDHRDDRSTIRSPESVRYRMLRFAVAAAACCCILLPGLLSGSHFATYSHFFTLVFYKLKYFVKPGDPTLLPFEVRAFWVGPFHSPDPLHFFVFALPIILLLPNPVARLSARARSGDVPATFVLSFLVIFFALFLLMQRLIPLFGVFAALAGGGNAVMHPSTKEGRVPLQLSYAVVAFVLVISVLQDFAWEGSMDLWRRVARVLKIPRREKYVVFPYQGDVEGSMLSWIKRNTEEDAVVLSLHYLSPQVLTYTDRATNLNDFFESPRLREKARTFLKLLYSSERRLLEFCAEQQSRYLLISTAVGCDPTRDSPLYQAGFTDIPPGCAAYRLLFEPARLEGFELVYENEMYRVFRVGITSEERPWSRSPLFYEKELLWQHGGDIQAFYHSIMRIYALTARGRSLLREGREGEAETALAEALRIFYFYPAWRTLATLYARKRRLQEMNALTEFAYHYDPNRSEIRIELARIRLALGKSEGVRELLDRCSSLSTTEQQQRDIEQLRRQLDHLSREGR